MITEEMFEKLIVETMQKAYTSYIAGDNKIPEGFENVDSFCTGFKMGMSALVDMLKDRNITHAGIDAKSLTDEVINKMKGGK